MTDHWAEFAKELERDLDISHIDTFIELLSKTTSARIADLENQFSGAKSEDFRTEIDFYGFQDHLTELHELTESTQILGHELSIVALYKCIEIHTKKIVLKYLPLTNPKHLSYFDKLCAALPFDLTQLNGIDYLNELRLLNNSIKHQGVVSADLAKAFPTWTEGEEFHDLDKAYSRLSIGIKSYARELAVALQAIPQP